MLLVATPKVHADWPNWRGPARQGSVASGTYPEQWKTDFIAWKTALPGKGGSTPLVWRNRVYVTTPAEGHDAVMAFDLAGKQQWLTKLGAQSPPKRRTLGY